MENALRTKPLEIKEQYERQLRELQEAYGEAMLELLGQYMLTVVDRFTRECLAIDVGQSLKGEDVARVLTAITETRGCHAPSSRTTAASSSPR